MYVGRKPKRRSRRLILLLLILIAAASSGAYYLWAYQPDWSRPFEPTPTPTRTAQSYILEAEAYYGQGQLDEDAIHAGVGVQVLYQPFYLLLGSGSW